jgi:hypothetical protein
LTGGLEHPGKATRASQPKPQIAVKSFGFIDEKLVTCRLNTLQKDQPRSPSVIQVSACVWDLIIDTQFLLYLIYINP